MIEFFDKGGSVENNSFSDFEKSMEDTVVIAATREAKRRETVMNGGTGEFPADEVQKTLDELDAMVAHVMHDQITLTGMVQKYDEGDESDFFFVQDVPGRFDGFSPSYRDGNINFDYLMAVTAEKKSGNILSVDSEVGPDTEYKSIRIQSKPDEVFVKFQRMHPVRAQAILAVSYPETLRELDNRVIHDKPNGDELAILGLRGFTIKKRVSDRLYDADEYMNAVTEYIKGMVSIDSHVPYIITIDGNYTRINTGEPIDIEHAKQSGLIFMVGNIITHDIEEFMGKDDEAALGLIGTLLDENNEAPGKDIILPLESIAQIRSLRRLVEESWPKKEVSE